MRAKSHAVAFGLAVAMAAGWVGAGGAPPDAYGVLRAKDNPLVQAGARVAVPDIVWEKVQVRSDHPRLLFTKDTLPALRKRLQVSPVREAIIKAADKGSPFESALLYQISGRHAYARMAIRALLGGEAGRDEPYIFDWTYDAMTEAQRKEAIRILMAGVQVDRASGWPRCSPYTAFPDDPRPSNTPPEQWAPFYNWTFHDQDWSRRYARDFENMLALAGHVPRMAEGVRNYWEYSLKDAALFYDSLRDGSAYQGYYWSVTNRVEQIVRTFNHMKHACGLDFADYSKHPYLGNMGRWLLYCSDPYSRVVIYNYGDGRMVNVPRSALLASNSLARDPHVQWLLHESCPGFVRPVEELLYYDRTIPKRSPADVLPPSRAFPGTGLAVMRSGWRLNDIWTCVRFGKWFDIHQHGDVGSFILYCKSVLTPDSGFYCPGYFHRNYACRSVAHNTITVRDPKAEGPLNDGNQLGREVRTWSWGIGRRAWLYNQQHFDRGRLLAFETKGLYDYCAGDAAGAYNPAPADPKDPQEVEKAKQRKRCNEFVRQIVFLRDGFFVVFDRVEVPRPELETRWLMHLVGEPKIDGRLVATQVKGHIEDYDGSVTVSQGRQGSVLRCHSLLPAKRRIRRVGGGIPRLPCSSLVRVPQSRHRMATGSRWLWTDPLILYYNDPITGTKQPAIGLERDSPTIVYYEVTDTEVYLKLDAYERGRVDEVRLKFADYPSLLELVRDLALRDLWHLEVHYLPGYEYYNEGMNYAPAYQLDGWTRMAETAPELLGKPSDHGSWRIEVHPTEPAPRRYFLNVIHIQGSLEGDAANVSLNDQPDRAEVTVVFGQRTYVIAFAKTGPVGGHIRITDAQGNVVADRDFAQDIVQKD